MAIIRQKREKHFSIVSNEILSDKRLSFKARGLLVYMLSMKDDWKFYVNELEKHSQKDGRESIQNALAELEKAGYLQRIQKRQKNGRFGSQDWLLVDTPIFSPQTGFPYTAKPQTVKPETANPQLTNTNSNKNLNKQVLNISSSHEENQEQDSQKEIDPFIEYFERTMFVQTTPTQKTRLRGLLKALPYKNREEMVESIVQGMPVKLKDPVSYFAKSLINAAKEAKLYG